MKKATILISSVCNHDCDFCLNIWHNKNNPITFNTFIDEKLFYDAADKIVSSGIKSITICGGEPLLHPKFKDFINYLHNQNVFIRIQTNGVYLNTNMINFLKNKIGEIEISLHGTKEVQEEISKAKTFDTIISNILNCLKENLLMTTNFVINKKNHNDLENYIYLLNKINIPMSYFTILYNAGKVNDKLKLNKNEMSHFISKLADYSLISKTKIMFQGCYPPCELDQIKHKINFMSPCGAGKDEIAIQPNGMITLCPAHPKPMGFIQNKDNDTFKELINSSKEYLLNQDLPKSECSTCALLQACRGGCLINRKSGSNQLLNSKDELFEKVFSL